MALDGQSVTDKRTYNTETVPIAGIAAYKNVPRKKLHVVVQHNIGLSNELYFFA